MTNNVEHDAVYQETVDYLYSLCSGGILLGLDTISALTDAIGRPAFAYPSVHVAGTNGKGSTSTMIASILTAAGFKVGLYLSPHLINFTERISVNGRQISEADVIALTQWLRGVMQERLPGLNPTFFEFVTALAMRYFHLQQVDFGVFETGLGGRFDATNILEPVVSAITTISFDHQAYLGNTLGQIAFEKAGIIKHNTPTVTAVHGEALETIRAIAQNKRSELHCYGKDFFSDLIELNQRNHTVFNYDGYQRFDSLELSLPGRHQIKNAAIALRVCEIMEQKKLLNLSRGIVSQGLAYAKIEGRFELVSDNPLIALDGAHNPEAVQALVETVKDRYPAKDVIVIAGVMADKDIQNTLEPLTQIARLMIITKPDGQRAALPKDIINLLSLHDMTLFKQTDTLQEALALARQLWQNNDLILVTGSFYTAGQAKALLKGKGILSELRE